MEETKNFKTAAEAFGKLSQEVQAHSHRVEKYAQLLFMELCAAEEYLGNAQSRARLKVENCEAFGEAARYHDLGKVLVPDFYQWDSARYSPEEQALYRKHCADGAQLMEQLMQSAHGVTPAHVNLLKEVLACHHECWDGTGWPNRTEGERTPVLGRIVAVADALDHLLMDTRTENPVEDAVNALMEGSGTRFDPIIMGLLYDAKRKVEKIFSQYAGQSRAIPKALRIIRRKSKRPFFLMYRPMTALADQTVAAVEAEARFRRGKELVSYSDMSHLVREKKEVQQLALMLLLEAADTRRRMEVCQVGGQVIALNMIPGMLRKRGFASSVAKLVTDTDMDPRGLCLMLTAEDYEGDSFGLRENCEKLSQLGFSLMLTGVSADKLDMEKLTALKITHCRLPALAEQETLDGETLDGETLGPMLEAGIRLIGDGVDTYRVGGILANAGVTWATGILPGGYVTEDEFITGELALVK